MFGGKSISWNCCGTGKADERRFHLGKDHSTGFCTGNNCGVMWIIVLSVPGMLSDVLAGGAWSQVCAGLDVALGAQFCQKKKKTFYGQGAGLGKSWTVWIKQQGLSWWCKEVEMLMLKKPKRESPCSGSSWLLSVGTRTVAARAKLKLVLLLLKCVLEIFRVIGGNLDFIQVLFLIESVSSSTI